MYQRAYGCGAYGGRRKEFFNSTPVNITETDQAYTIHLYAPGLVKEKISVTTQKDMLSIHYKADREESSEHFTRREYRPENLERTFDLKGKVDIDKIKSTYQEGILIIELPKTESARRPAQQVNIK
jgi:HSP20 family protein